MSPQQTERRRAARVRAELPLTLGAADAKTSAKLRDVSTNGLCCVSPEPIPEMTLVGIDLTVDGAEAPITIQGAVVRCDPVPEATGEHEVAVFFTQISPEALDVLGRFIEREQAGAS